MPKKRTTRQPLLSDQLRQAIRDCGLSQYRIAKETEIEQSAISRFLTGERTLSGPAMDRLGAFLDLEIIVHGPRQPTNKSK